ncbi:predicted protein [Heterostelium album PN500]|uniref:WD40 repeat-containing protein SMU1 n=1 Tax=Heterostelium pallidum (strain ATCC 26659 / Pp 5 / PN500) TaxID=670386 RepID=D3BL79_HETP5|nr:predicted protein [Heterostelium album PN500]EFA77813.1 predicted protein [Heterostelium album PN500]|eukprot:XP_020429941.1 predicted protein [Heterostelium album PN500]
MSGHRKNVKCVEFIGGNGLSLATGSSDNTIKIWNTETGAQLANLTGNTSRIWDLSSSASGKLMASAAGDGVVKVWDISSTTKPTCPLTIKAHEGDAYAVQFHPGQEHIVSGGYDKSIHLHDVRTGQLKLEGHTGMVYSVAWSQQQSLLASSSHDNTAKVWWYDSTKPIFCDI